MKQAPVEVMQTEEPVSRKRPWEKVDEDGNKIKRKKVPGAKNRRVRNYVQPRNACQCLNELVPGVTYEAEPEEGVAQQFGVSVTVNGVTYTGYGPSKQIAKQNAAETALVSFVKAPPAKTAQGEDEENETKEEDKTPWATLAAFAMYKLFNDWKDGRIGTGHSQAQGGGFDLRDYLATKAGSQINTARNTAGNNLIAQHLLKTTTVGLPATAKPAKHVPDNAAIMHPVAVLHQMRPGIEYITNKTTGEDNKPHFNVSVTIEGQEFTGEGPNLKKAKANLARDAIYSLFGVESTFEIPA